MTQWAHRLIQGGNLPADFRFRRALRQIEQTQRRRLSSILKATRPSLSIVDYPEFCRSFPLTNYSDWVDKIAEQRAGRSTLHPNCRRFQPTSGSTHSLKWIPYPGNFLQELDSAIGPWQASQARRYPGILQGKHYWSLSWIPQEQRELLHSTDDREFFPLWKQLLWKATQCGDPGLAQARTFEAARFATAVHLAAASDLSFLSVWSPTFALSLFEFLRDHRETIARVLTGEEYADLLSDLSGCAPLPASVRQAQVLSSWDGTLNADFFKALWPRLTLVSAWDTASSTVWALELQKLFPHAHFEGKGLWATEGVVTIPYEGQRPLAVTSHFYEWQDLETLKVLPSWELKIGQEVQPVLTTGSGLLRYLLNDRMKVCGFLGETPTLEFLGRKEGVDLVGEKVSPEDAGRILARITEATGKSALALIASRKSRSYRVLLLAALNPEEQRQTANLLEEELSRLFHYRVARELNQLLPATVELTDNALESLSKIARDSGKIEGNIKVEPLYLEP